MTHFGRQRANAVAHLQVVDAAECAVVEYNNGDLRVLLHCGRDLGVKHHKRTVANECVYFLIRLSQLGAERTRDLIAHAGSAVFHIVGVRCVGYPQTLEVSRQRACCCNHDCVVVCLLTEDADCVGLGDGATDLVNEIVHDLFGPAGNARYELALAEALALVLNAQNAQTLFFPNLADILNFGGVAGLVAVCLELFHDRFESNLCVADAAGCIQLFRMELGSIDCQNLNIRVAEQHPLGAGYEVVETSADTNNEVAVLAECVRR